MKRMLSKLGCCADYVFGTLLVGGSGYAWEYVSQFKIAGSPLRAAERARGRASEKWNQGRQSAVVTMAVKAIIDHAEHMVKVDAPIDATTRGMFEFMGGRKGLSKEQAERAADAAMNIITAGKVTQQGGLQTEEMIG